MLRLLRFCAVASALLACGSALAAPCAGFTDVDSTDPFCPNVEWVRNRNVTLGCTATNYCPAQAVSRLAMAAFLSRLGAAMTPVQLRADAAPGVLDVDASPVVCQSTVFDTATYPRRAIIDGALSASAAFDIDVSTDLVMTSDGGANWVALNVAGNPLSLSANRWTSYPAIAHADLAHGLMVRFGIRVSRSTFPGTADFLDSRCQLRVIIFSRDGTSSPF